MRSAFARTLVSLAEQDPNLFLITGDLGFGVLNDFQKRFPDRFINAGVAEQNMTGLAAGMAFEGKTVFTYSIGNFSTLRCLEQIRNDAAYHNLNVNIVCIGGGYTYGSLGFSHHATEDLAILRALPHIAVISPGDPQEAEWATRALHRTPGTGYLRLGRGGEPNIHASPLALELGRAIGIRETGEIAMLATGAILQNAVEACDILSRNGLVSALYSVPTLHPLDEALIERLGAQCSAIITVEEHSIRGGLGTAVAEVLAELRGVRARLIRLGLDTDRPTTTGDQAYLRQLQGLAPEQIAETVLARCRRS
jgi:transketolase